jgi:hypothetical protein
MTMMNATNIPTTVSVPSSNGAPPVVPRAVRRLRYLSCGTPSGMQRFTRQHLSRVERFRRRLTPRGRQVFRHLTLVELAVLLRSLEEYLTEPEA